MAQDEFGKGLRIGHLGLSPVKVFTPKGDNKKYLYHKSLVPSISAYEDINKRSGAGMDNLSPKQIINTVAGDNNYYNQLLNHYDSVPDDYWENVGLSYNRKAAEEFGDTKLPIYPGVGQAPVTYLGAVPKTTNSVVELPGHKQPRRSFIAGIDQGTRGMRSQLNFLRKFKNLKNNFGVNSSAYDLNGSDQPLNSFRGSVLHHEMTHSSMLPGKTNSISANMGGGLLTGTPNYLSIRHNGKDPALVLARELHNYNPVAPYRSFIIGTPRFGSMLNDMQKVNKADKRALTSREYDSAGFTPYDLDEVELTRAVSIYNQNRNNLLRNIRRNKLQYMLAGFDPWKLTWATMQPKFYSHDNAGRDRFIADMEFYRKNPEMAELLGVEGRRVIPSYHNMTKVLESKDPKNKELQNKVRHIRDRFINYRILGNRSNSVGVPSNVTYPRSNSRTAIG